MDDVCSDTTVGDNTGIALGSSLRACDKLQRVKLNLYSALQTCGTWFSLLLSFLSRIGRQGPVFVSGMDLWCRCFDGIVCTAEGFSAHLRPGLPPDFVESLAAQRNGGVQTPTLLI